MTGRRADAIRDAESSHDNSAPGREAARAFPSPWPGLIISFAVPFVLYARTAAPGLVGGDSAELAAGACFLSFVHAPGYPLYLLLGKLFALLPIADVAFRITSMSVFFAAATTALLYLFLLRLLRHVPAALLGVGAFVFSFTFWQQATIAEVYTLNTFLLLVLFHLALSWDRAPPESKRLNLLLFALALGVSLCNHVSPVLFLPAFAGFAWTGGFRPHRSPGTVLAMLSLTAAGLSLYLYLPIRTWFDPPVINWTGTQSLEQFLHVVTATQFRQQMFALSPTEFLYNLALGATHFLIQFSLVGGVLGVAGIRTALREERRWAGLLSIASVVVILYALNYDIVDIEAYYLPFYLCFTVFLGFELRKVWDWRRSAAARVALIAALFIPYVFLYRAMDLRLDRSDAYGWMDLAAALETLPANATVIAPWSHFTTLRYQQLVGDQRHDVELIEIDSLAEHEFRQAVAKYRQQGRPVYFTRDTDVIAEQYDLEPEGYFLRVEPRRPPVSSKAPVQGVEVGNGLQAAARCDEPGRRRQLIPVEIWWALAESPAGSPDRLPPYELVLSPAGSDRVLVRQTLFPPRQWQTASGYRQRRFLYVPQDAPDKIDLRLLTNQDGQPVHSVVLQSGISVTD